MTAAEAPPHGFRRIPLADGFFESFGPVHLSTKPGDARLAFLVQACHLNPSGVCHGGAIATFADMQAFPGQWLVGIVDRFTPTITLTTDYIAPAPLGAWIEVRMTTARATSRLLFTAGEIAVVGGAIIGRTNAVFNIPSAPHPDVALLTSIFAG